MGDLKNITFTFKDKSYKIFIDSIKQLSALYDDIFLYIDRKNIYAYCALGNDGGATLAFKNYCFRTDDMLNYDDFDFALSFIIVKSKKFINNINILDSDDIQMRFSYRESLNADTNSYEAKTIELRSGKMKIKWICGITILNIITLDKLNSLFSMSEKRLTFDISREDFSNIYKLSSINSDISYIQIDVQGSNVVVQQENKWEMTTTTDLDNLINKSMMIDRSFLKFINTKVDNIIFDVYDNFILIKDDVSNLMLSFQQNFE